MKKLYSVALIFLLTTSSMAGDLASSFKEAVALAATEDKDRATRIYAEIDLKDYYQHKYMPVFQSCLKSTEHPRLRPLAGKAGGEQRSHRRAESRQGNP